MSTIAVNGARIASSGELLEIYLDDIVTVNDSSGFTLAGYNLVYAGLSASEDTLYFTVIPRVLKTDVLPDLDYTKSGSGITNALSDYLASFTGQTVINESTQVGRVMAVSVLNSLAEEGVHTGGGNPVETASFTPNASAKQILVMYMQDESPLNVPTTGCTIGGVSMDFIGHQGSSEGNANAAYLIDASGNSGVISLSGGSNKGYLIVALAIDGYFAASNFSGCNIAANANSTSPINHPDNTTDWLYLSNYCVNLALTALAVDAALTDIAETTDVVQTSVFAAYVGSRTSTGALDDGSYYTQTGNQQWSSATFLFSDTPVGSGGSGGFGLGSSLLFGGASSSNPIIKHNVIG